jgi:methionyl-tRNA synthetase
MWKRCFKNGDISKKTYQSKYCVGCELEKTDSELTEGKCPVHPNLEIELIDEENYFFRFSKYQKPLLDFYGQHPDFVVPESKYKEIKKFVADGLQDFSISRLKAKMPWGINVPNDPEHVMYVWFDALTFYLSNLGWPDNEKMFSTYWPGTQVAGKDNLRQQTAIWQAMLMSARLPNSKQIYIHGFVSLNGQKMSKSLGNVVDPFELVQKYGTDAVRYYFLTKINPYEDSDFTYEKFEVAYNSDLANGLGNLVSRVAKLYEKAGLGGLKQDKLISQNTKTFLSKYQFDQALGCIWLLIRQLDQKLNEVAPWTKTENELVKVLEQFNFAGNILNLAYELQIFLPETAKKIENIFTADKIVAAKPLFPRI